MKNSDASSNDILAIVARLASAGLSVAEIRDELQVPAAEVEDALAAIRKGLIPFLTNLAERMSGDNSCVAGWLSSDHESRYWLRNRLRLNSEQWSRFLLMPMPQGAGSGEGFTFLASTLGLSSDRAATLSADLWRARCLGALSLAVQAADSGPALAWTPTRTTMKVAPNVRREPLPLAAHASDGLSLITYESTPSIQDLMTAVRRRLDADAGQLLEIVRRAGLSQGENGDLIEDLNIEESLRVGHMLDWPLAMVVTSDTVREARDDLDHTNMIGRLSEIFDWESLAANWASDRKNREAAPQAREGLLLASRGHGIAYISEDLGETEQRWVAAQLIAAFLHYRISVSGGASNAHSETFNQVLFTTAMNRQRPWLVLFEERPELGTALRIVAPASERLSESLLTYLRNKQRRPREMRAPWLAQTLDLPLRVAEQRLAQLSLPLG